MKRSTRFSAFVVTAAVVVTGAMSVTSVDAKTKKTTSKKSSMKKTADIVDTAVAAGSFKTLAAALNAAGLVDTLKGKGPFTVFAPTDEAFAALPAGLVDKLLKPANKEALTKILTYHVVSGKVLAADVVKLMAAKTVEGSEVAVKVAGGKVTVDAANVIKTDIIASNGVIHVIDKVLVPKDVDPATLK